MIRNVLAFALGLGLAMFLAVRVPMVLAGVKPVPADTPAYADHTVSKSGHDITRLDPATVNLLAAGLTDEQRRILLNKGTEPAFCGNLLDNPENGTYCCRLCKLPLFASQHKFKSGTGWPSFYQPVDEQHIQYKNDTSFGMVRTEILCVRCGGHLGHVFEDGPRPTGLRYCLNSASMEFFTEDEPLPERSQPIATETAYLAGGCFWGIEHYFQTKVPGVIDAVSGYQNGDVEDPSYKDVCSGLTGHAESVKVVFDPARVSYRELLEVFFWIHDPTQLNRQGPDIGTQYRSGVYTTTPAQQQIAEEFVKQLEAEDPRFDAGSIVTEVEPAERFYEAEDYHQDYNAKTGRQCYVPRWTEGEPPSILAGAK